MFVYGLYIVIVGPMQGEMGGFRWGIIMTLGGAYGLWTMWRTHRDVKRLNAMSDKLHDRYRIKRNRKSKEE